MLTRLGVFGCLVVVREALPLLTLLSLERDLVPWAEHCECVESYKPATWGMQSAWSCPVASLQPRKPECGVQCYDERGRLISTLCPEHFLYLDCECRFVLPGDTVPFSGQPAPVNINWPSLLDFVFCARVCQQGVTIRRFGSNGYACILNTSVPEELQKICFSGCGASQAQLEQHSHDVNFDRMSTRDIATSPLVPLVFLCPSKRSASCNAHDPCPSQSCAPASDREISYELQSLVLPDSTLRVVTDSANDRQLLSAHGDIETCLGLVRCQGPLETSCVNGGRLLFDGESQSCACQMDLPCLARYVRAMVHIVADLRATRPEADFRVLVIGFGTGVLSMALQLASNATVESVDIDDTVLQEMAIPFFGYDAFHPRLQFQKQDCLRALQLRDGLDYDAVLVDAFAMDGTVPEHCRSRDFLLAASALVARRQGLLLHNIWTRHFNTSLGVREAYETLHHEYLSYFSKVEQVGFSVFPGPEFAHQVVLVGGSTDYKFMPH